MTVERRLLACGVAAWLVTFTIAATAQDAQPAANKGDGSDEPIEISSDRLVMEQNQKQVVLLSRHNIGAKGMDQAEV